MQKAGNLCPDGNIDIPGSTAMLGKQSYKDDKLTGSWGACS